MIIKVVLLVTWPLHLLTAATAQKFSQPIAPTVVGGGLPEPLPLNDIADPQHVSVYNESLVGGELRNCTPAAIEQFPRPFMDLDIRRHGGLLVHIFISILMFISLSVLCEEYFVPALEVLCERLKVDPDVAGATFMAAASSIPAIAASVIAILFAKGDLGVSTTLGSAVLNAAGVVSVSALFAGKVLILHRWPMYRDSFFFLVSVVVMLIAIYDEKVTWYESLVLLLCYVAYAVMMYFDERLEKFFQRFSFLQDKNQDPSLPFPAPPLNRETSSPLPLSVQTLSFDYGMKASKSPVSEIKLTDRPNLSHLTDTPPRRRLSLISLRSSSSLSDIFQKENPKKETTDKENGDIVQADDSSKKETSEKDTVVKVQESENPEAKEEATPSPFSVPKRWYSKIVWILMMPLSIVFYYTIPDCKKKHLRKFFAVTFCISTVYIGVASYVLVWMIAVIGFTLSISDTVMGLTFLSIGVTLPDVVASLLVVRKGFGDMAVCNALGSNIFEILVGLGLPWIIKTGMMNPGTEVIVESSGLFISTLCLLATVFFLIILTHFNKWKMNKFYGIVLLIWYLVFMVISTLFELNVFGNHSPVTCDSDY